MILTIITTVVLAISAICNIISIVAMANDYYEASDFIMRGAATLIQLTFAVLIPTLKKKSIAYIGLICAALFFYGGINYYYDLCIWIKKSFWRRQYGKMSFFGICW